MPKVPRAGELMHRTATFQRDSVNIEKRTAALSFASALPIQRWFGMEELVISDKAMRHGRLADGGPLLVDHNPTDHIGVVEAVYVGGGKARAHVRFGNSARAEEVFRDVQDGIRGKVSVGYVIHAAEKREQSDASAIPHFRVIDWEPLELSLVAIPADTTTAIGRAHSGSKQMTKEQRRAQNRAERARVLASVSDDDAAEFSEMLDDEEEAERIGGDMRTRVLDDEAPEKFRVERIRQLARQWKDHAEVGPISVAAINSGLSIAAFREEIMGIVTRVTPTHTGRLEERASYGSLPSEQVHHGKLTAYENTPAGIERAYTAGMWFKSAAGNLKARDWCVQRGVVAQRVLTEGLYASAGVAVPDLVAADIIRNIEEYGLVRRLARNFPMSSASLTVPARTGGISTAYVGETDSVSPADPTLTGVGLMARELAGATRISHNALDDAAPDLADFIVRELGQAFAKAEDDAGIIGDGTSTYGGMLGVNTRFQSSSYTAGRSTAATNHDTFAEIDTTDLAAVIALAPESAKSSKMCGWICSAGFRDAVFGRLAYAASGNDSQSIQQGVQRFMGYQIFTTPSMPSNAATDYTSLVMCLFGAFDRAVAFGDRRAITLVMDNSKYVLERQLLVLATSRYDIVPHSLGDTTNVGQLVCLFGA